MVGSSNSKDYSQINALRNWPKDGKWFIGAALTTTFLFLARKPGTNIGWKEISSSKEIEEKKCSFLERRGDDISPYFFCFCFVSLRGWKSAKKLSRLICLDFLPGGASNIDESVGEEAQFVHVFCGRNRMCVFA